MTVKVAQKFTLTLQIDRRQQTIFVIHRAGRSLRELSTALRIHWTLWAPSNRISGKILHSGYRRAGAHIQGARSCPRQCCMHKCSAGDRPADVCPITKGGRRWLTYSLSARARVHQFQRVSEPSGFSSKAFLASLSGALPGLRSNAQMGLPGCVDRTRARIARPDTAQWFSRGLLEYIGQLMTRRRRSSIEPTSERLLE